MTPFSLAIILAGWVALWTAVKGDGRGGYNPLLVIADAAAGRRVPTNASASGAAGVSASGAGSTKGGGLILHPGNDAGHQDHLHFEHPSSAVVVAVGSYCVSRGFAVAEHPAFGGVTGNCNCDPHCGDAHCENRAIDVNWRQGGDERSKLIALAGDIAKHVQSFTGAEVAA